MDRSGGAGRLAGKVAIVTGGGAGIGRHEALQLAQAGARVVVNDLGVRHPDAAERVVEEIRREGGQAVSSRDDVATMSGGGAIVAKAMTAFGRLDILVNNAGIGRLAAITEMSEADWDAAVAVNLKGAFTTVRHAAPVFKAQGSGVIVNTSSDAGTGTFAGANYAASKEGVIGFTRAIAWELGRFGVLSLAIRPRAFDGDLPAPDKHASFVAFEEATGLPMVGVHPFRHAVDPRGAEVGAVVAWLAEGRAAALNGWTLQVGGGEIGLWAQPTVDRAWLRPQGWDAASLDDVADKLVAGLEDRRSGLPEGQWLQMAERRVRKGATEAARGPAA